MKKQAFIFSFLLFFLLSNSVFANTYPQTLEDIRKLTFAHDQITGTDYETDFSEPVLIDGSDALSWISTNCPYGCFTDSDHRR